jgi:peptidoglycan-associated lipoprotein
VGCRKGLQNTTPLPGRGAQVGQGNPNDLLDPSLGGLNTGGGINELSGDFAQPPGGGFANWIADSQTFAQETVYFEFDKHNVRPGDVGKIERVAQMMKTMPGKALRIEGHCDERGTEEYNRSLGERRALSVREFLVKLGLDPQWVETVSFGEDRPSDMGRNESAYQANRRAEFILLSAPGAN